MGYRSPELHISALSPSEYSAYTPIVAKLLEQQDAHKGSDSIARKDLHQLLKNEFSADEGRLQAISATLPSYPSSHLSAGEVYATLRLLAHEQQSSNKDPSTPVVPDELAFVQTKPLSRSVGPRRINNQTAGKKDNATQNHEKQIPSGPLLPPPRRQTDLHVTTTKTAREEPSPIRRTREDKVLKPKHVEKSSPVVPRRIGHVKSKSIDVSATPPSSTPFLNAFRTPRSGGTTGFVAPPPVPPKPTKMANAVKSESTAPLLVAIDDDNTASKPDSNPFRRKSVPNATICGGGTVDVSHLQHAKPPLPPRQSLTHNQLQPANQIELGVTIEPPSLPSRQAASSSSTSTPRKGDTVPRTSGSQFRAPPSTGVHHVQPTSLLQPSRLIKEGLLAAQMARESQTSTRVHSPNNIITLANYTGEQHDSTQGTRGSIGVGSGSERSYSKRHRLSGMGRDDAGRHRSSTLSSITTGGTTSSGSSISTVDPGDGSRNSNPRTLGNGAYHPKDASPFADPDLIDTSLPPPPRRSVPSRRDGTNHATPAFDIIAASGDEEAQASAYVQGNLSRRSTLKSNHALSRHFNGSTGPVEQGLLAMKDLGEDVRRAAEGVGKDLEWVRGGRGGRTLGMTFPSEEDHGGDVRKGLIENIERDNTGSTTLSDDFENKL